MIKVTNLANKKHMFFQNYHDLCEHINRIEKFKALSSEKTGWRFSRRSHEALAFFSLRCPTFFEEACTPQEKEALEKGLGLIEILRGDATPITQILYTSTLDLIPFKKAWCLDYCREHGYMVVEFEGKASIKKKK
jgi:hypothetical protein